MSVRGAGRYATGVPVCASSGDMNDGTFAPGGTWLSVAVPAVQASAALTTRRSLLLTTWDENGGSLGLGRHAGYRETVPDGFQQQVPYTHAACCARSRPPGAWPPLTASDSAATPMTGFSPAG